MSAAVAADECAEDRIDEREQGLASALEGGDDQHQRPSMADGWPSAVHPHHGEAAEQAGNDEEQAGLERGRRRVGEIDHRQRREPADPERAEELRPQMRDDRDGDSVDRPHAEGDEERGDDGDWRAEPGDALQEGREHPSESDDDEQVVATEAGDPLAQRVVSAGLIGDLVEQQRRPDHIENEDGVPDALRARDGNRLPRCGEGEQGHGRSREHPHGPRLRCCPAQQDQKDQEHHDRQERRDPAQEIDR